MQSKGELKHSTAPRPKEIEDYLRCGLAADEGDTTLEFQESWSQEAVDNWLRSILPKPFEWLDARYGRPDTENGDVHWVLLGRDRKTLFVVARKTTTGAELSKMKGIAGRNPSQWSIRIGPYNVLKQTRHLAHVMLASKHAIPPSVYTSWDQAIARVEAGDIELDESDGELSSEGQTRKRRRIRQMIEGIGNPTEHLSSKATKAIGSPLPDNFHSDSSVEFPELVFPSPGAKPVTPSIPANESQSTDISRRQLKKGKAVKHMRTRASKRLATLFATSSSESEVEVVEESAVGIKNTNCTKGSRRDWKGKGRAASESAKNNRGRSSLVCK